MTKTRLLSNFGSIKKIETLRVVKTGAKKELIFVGLMARSTYSDAMSKNKNK